MILTGNEIEKEVNNGNILLKPFSQKQLNPNSYNYRLGNKLKKFVKFENGKSLFETVTIDESGFILEPNQMYLANTKEIIGSSKYAMSLIGKSSLGRLGLFLQVSANLGHTASKHKWTLELVACMPVKIYPEMQIGQVSFWTNEGEVDPYSGKYSNFSEPQESI